MSIVANCDLTDGAMEKAHARNDVLKASHVSVSVDSLK